MKTKTKKNVKLGKIIKSIRVSEKGPLKTQRVSGGLLVVRAKTRVQKKSKLND